MEVSSIGCWEVTAIATAEEGARGTGTQKFKLDCGGVIFCNSDSGFEIEVKG